MMYGPDVFFSLFSEKKICIVLVAAQCLVLGARMSYHMICRYDLSVLFKDRKGTKQRGGRHHIYERLGYARDTTPPTRFP